MYDVKPNLVIGFHGCDRSVRDSLLMNPKDYKISQKPFDWLGHGLYFWENNYERALEWATQKQYRGGIKESAVVGAVLSLGHCCDFLDKRYIELLTFHFSYMKPWYMVLGNSSRNPDSPATTAPRAPSYRTSITVPLYNCCVPSANLMTISYIYAPVGAGCPPILPFHPKAGSSGAVSCA
jgi:hypothetical protein